MQFGSYAEIPSSATTIDTTAQREEYQRLVSLHSTDATMSEEDVPSNLVFHRPQNPKSTKTKLVPVVFTAGGGGLCLYLNSDMRLGFCASLSLSLSVSTVCNNRLHYPSKRGENKQESPPPPPQLFSSKRRRGQGQVLRL